MADNVIKFRKIEKKPEPPKRKQPGWPTWAVWLGFVVVAVALFGLKQQGISILP